MIKKIWRHLYEKLNNYKNPLKLLIFNFIIYRIWGVKHECSRHCPLPDDITDIQKFLHIYINICAIVIPIWFVIIWIRIKYEEDGHLD